MSEPRAPLRVVFFGTYEEGHHPRVRVLREGLEASGCQVDVVNVPLRYDTAARVRLASEPWRAPAAAVRVVAAWVRLLVRSRRVPRPDVVVVGYLGHFDVHLARCRWPRSRLVLDYLVSLADTAHDRRIASGRILDRFLSFIDRAALRQADVVVVDTEANAEALGPAQRSKSLVVPVGAPTAWFRAGDTGHQDAVEPAASGPLSVVFFGLYTPLQGAPVIGEAMAKLTSYDIDWMMVGSGQDRASAERAASGARVTWRDWVDPGELPALVARHHVCLGIFSDNEKARRVVPNKVFQGAAAGCAIVTSDTPEQRAALADAALYVAPGDPIQLATTLARLHDDRDLVAHRRRAARELAEARFTPQGVVAGLVAALGPEEP